ncbi:MAG: lipopolysaccharide biosynthesis protein [Candidatus Limnocylindrales bacterium]
MNTGLRTRVETLRPIFGTDWLWIILAQLAAVAGTLVLLKVVSNVASPGDLGRFGLILAVAGGVNSLAFGAVIAWTNRHYQEGREAGRLPAYFRTLAAASAMAIAAMSTIVLLAIVLAPDTIARLGITPQLAILGLIIGILQSANEVAVTVSNAALRRRPAAIFLVGARWFPVALILACFRLGFRSVNAYGAAVAIALGAVLAVQIGQLLVIESTDSRQRPRAAAGGSYLRSLATYALPYVLWGIPAYIITFGDRYVLAYFTDPATVGTYIAMSAATMSVVNVFGTAVNRVIEPAVYATSGAGVDLDRVVRAHRMIRTAISAIIVILVPIVAIYGIFPRQVITIFTAASYGTYAGNLWVLMLAGLFFLVGQELFLHGNVEKRLWAYLPVRLIHVTIFAIAMAVLVPKAGLPGLTIALLVSYVAQTLLLLAANRWIVRRR